MKIPRIGPGGRKLTGSTGIAEQSPQQASRKDLATSQLFQVVQAGADKFEQLKSQSEIMDAQNEARRRLSDLEQQAIDDPDVWNADKYIQEISTIKDETSSMVSLPYAKEKYDNSYESMALPASVSIQGTFRKRQIRDAQVKLFDGVDLMGETYRGTTGMSPKEAQVVKQLQIQNMEIAFRDAVADGLITPNQARSNIDAQKAKWIEADIRNQIAIDPEGAREQLLSPAWDLDSAEVAEWNDVIDKQVKRNKTVVDVQRNEKYLQNTGQVITNLEQTSVEDLIRMLGADQMKADVVDDLVSWKLDPNSPQYETNKEVWLEMARDSTNPNLDLVKFNESIARAIANKDIQPSDGANLANTVQELYKNAIAFKSQDSPMLRSMRASMDYIKDWAVKHPTSQTPDQVAYSLTNDLVRNVMEKKLSPEQITEEARNLVKEQVKATNPTTVGLDDVPNSVGNQKNGFNSVYEGDTKLKANKKSKGKDKTYSQEDLAFTAEQHNISIEEVKKKLGIK